MYGVASYVHYLEGGCVGALCQDGGGAVGIRLQGACPADKDFVKEI